MLLLLVCGSHRRVCHVPARALASADVMPCCTTRRESINRHSLSLSLVLTTLSLERMCVGATHSVQRGESEQSSSSSPTVALSLAFLYTPV